ncbi:ABC-type multidrug transport system, ATPase component [Halalkaliarchaeum sp. AArc-CO]|uniref:ABC transporter ATP-binding protein n=1 Tax=unclassified Halalkaliarchaeum TaxID=2678344 RepID=UPI00217E8E50|nr:MULTISPECIES: ABC transporter ATP-binding protein [unclassified Halalkaliarchaeum]MDR5672283.1 ABC transporter ATP-binding protein [Halalkaliarchaeum sp. AArc-GB]UWG50100.1 ABC-type multidrug transport system, ATPase component [Halalkaliarchaeum sp. AArc-CO]
MDAALVAEDVRKRYGETTALSGVSLSVDGGEVFGLIGPNGAGKTTLVRALSGTIRYDGSITVLGDRPTEVSRQRIGLLPQSFSPPARLTARELIGYYAGLYKSPRQVGEVLADVGLEDAADTWYENLSGGQRRRTCVGTALVNDPDVLFLDEPTTSIDPAGRRSLWSLIDRLAEGGTTVFLTSHSMAEVERLADRVGMLRDGELVAAGTPASLIAEYGGRSRLVVRGTVAPSDITDALADATGFEVTAAGGNVVFSGVTPADIPAAVDALESAGASYESLTWTEPSLEDVYLSLTGESFEGRRAPGAGIAVDGSATATPEIEPTVSADGGDE